VPLTPDSAGRLHNMELFAPSPDYFEIMALGQHHGLPTRLLDWTFRSLHAMYFAAVGASAAVYAPHAPPNRTMEEWALALGNYSAIHFAGARAAGNPHLHAQRGLFTYTDSTVSLSGRALSEPLDKVVETRVVSNDVALTRFTLLQDEAPELLDLLRQFDVSAISLFPMIDGAVRELREEAVLHPGMPVRMAPFPNPPK